MSGFVPSTLRSRLRGIDVRSLAPVFGFFVGHAALALVMRGVPLLGLMHALGCVVVGIYVAARRPLYQSVYLVMYIAGAEVLWRMTRAGVFWEFGKYAVVATLLVALLRTRGSRNRVLAVSYFALLVPSALLTLIAFDLDRARQQISFNLSGPLALALCVMVLSNVRLTSAQVRHAFFAFLGPVLGIAALAYLSTTTATDLQFVGDSNSTTSGGFGPNQVASVLGLGLLLVLLVLLEYRGAMRSRATLLIVAVLLAAQSALTFSRGGIVIASASAFMAILYLVRDPRTRLTLVVLGAMLFAVGNWLVVPRLDEFTGGKLVERYTSLDSSNRDVIATLDMRVFLDNPALGVGPGAASEMRREFGNFAVTSAAHTEYTRMLAEHGIPGLIAMVLLLVLALRVVRDAASIRARAVVVALLTWVALFMLINAMRIAAPSVILGVACAIANTSRFDPRFLDRVRVP